MANAAILCVIFNNEISNKLKPAVQPEQAEQQVSVNNNNAVPYSKDTSLKYIHVNPMLPFSGKTKAEIYAIRKKYVNTSIFSGGDYGPSDEVFGSIEDNKPWISNNVCRDKQDEPMDTTGPSEESRFINNPSVLIGLEYPFGFYNVTDRGYCRTDKTNLIPQVVLYEPQKKLITVTYMQLPFETNDWTFYDFNGLNARDFGYKYLYLDKAQSTYDITFNNSENISNGVYELNNFIHLGFSCRAESGCNNGSPRQEFIEFKNPVPGSESGKYVLLKLWKNKPVSPLQPADIYEKIVFQ